MAPDPASTEQHRATGADAMGAGAAEVGRLTRRAEFLRVAKGRRWHGVAMSIQAAAVGDAAGEHASCRFGFTVTKKVGNAVVRNRARRRLRAAVRHVAPDLPARADHDYVIVGRIEALRLPFPALGDEIVRGVAAVHRTGKPRGGHRRVAGAESGAGQGNPPERIRPTT